MTRYYRMHRPAMPWGFVPFHSKPNMAIVSRKINPRNWALSFVGCILALTEYKDNDSYRLYNAVVVKDWASNGKYVKVSRIDQYSGEPYSHTFWINSSLYYRFADSVQVFQLELKLKRMQEQVEQAKAEAEGVAKQQLSVLSQNTVTRALVHAYDNDYCHETAVALITAGHKMPDVTLSFEVTVPVTITLRGNDSYYPLRTLFGMTRGEVNGAKGLDIGSHDKVQSAIREQLVSGDISLYNANISHEDTDVTWKDPILRQVSNMDAVREVSTYRDY